MSLGLYVHIPFCKSKCFYCSFVSFEQRDALIDPYLAALRKEAQSYKGRQVNTVYIGGGTPTYLSLTGIESLFDIIRSNFTVSEGSEITIEANPATFDAEKARNIFKLGVNRVSLGVQSLNDEHLKYLGRPHSVSDARSSVKFLKEAGFKNISLDFIHSLPGEARQNVEDELSGLVGMGTQHLSLYTLSVPEGSEFHKRRVELPSQDEQREDYLFISRYLKNCGFTQYEVSNFSRSGYQCRHNVNYWQGGNYIGLGTAAHSHIDGHRWWNTDNIEGYIGFLNDGRPAKMGEERLSAQERFMETFLIGLRLTDGVDIKILQERLGVRMPREKSETVLDFIRQGLLVQDNGRLKTTMAGMLVLDEICSRLV